MADAIHTNTTHQQRGSEPSIFGANDVKTTEQLKDKAFSWALIGLGGLIILLLAAMCMTLVFQSRLSISTFGLGFFTSDQWNPVFGEFGALPFIVGTLLTSVIALVISIPFSFSIALCLGEHLRHNKFAVVLKTAIDLLSGIPSIIYGFWGLFVLAPLIQKLEIWLGVIPYGVGIFTASLILAIMIVPFSASLGIEIIKLVPEDLKEAALSLGGTQFDVSRRVILPYATSGLFAGTLMAFGRALSETMAVTMVIGNANSLPDSIFSPGNTLASAIANEFGEAVNPLYLSSLVQLGLVLLIITSITGILGRLILKRLT